MAGSGDPYCSLVNVASHADGSPILLISRLAAAHAKHPGRCQGLLMLDERAEGDPLEGAGIMLAGQAEEAARVSWRYLRRATSMPILPRKPLSISRFFFFRIRPNGAIWSRVSAVSWTSSPERFLTDISDAGALVEAEQGAIDHMNDDHLDAVKLYATGLLGAGGGRLALHRHRSDGIDMQAGPDALRLDFPQRVLTPAALRQTLKALSDQVRTATSI